jgi:transcriptional regulator with XRE-family HTH domain
VARNSIDTFPARLRELREAAGLSRDQLAVAAGTSSHSVTKMEQAKRSPSLELAWRLAQALGCTLDALVQPPSGPAAESRRGRPPKQPAKPSAKRQPRKGE